MKLRSLFGLLTMMCGALIAAAAGAQVIPPVSHSSTAPAQSLVYGSASTLGQQVDRDHGLPVDCVGGCAVTGPGSDIRATGTINAATLNAAYTVAINGNGIAGFTITGLTGTGATLTLEASNDGGTTWSTALSVNAGTGALPSTFTADTQFRMNAGGRTNIRLRVSTTGTGTVSVASNLSEASSDVSLASPLPPGTNQLGFVTGSNDGASGTGITQPTGGSGFLGWLSGIYKALTGTGTSAVQIQGTAADAATDAGNPLTAAGIYQSTLPTYTDGQRGRLHLGTRGSLKTEICVSNTTSCVGGNNAFADGTSNTPSGGYLEVRSYPSLNNGASNDQMRNNLNSAALITHSAASAGTSSADQTNYNGRGVNVCTDITAISTGSITTNIQIKDAASGKYITVLSSAAATTTGTTCLTVYPGAATTANVSLSMPLSRTWRVTTSGTFTGVTATVGASVVL